MATAKPLFAGQSNLEKKTKSLSNKYSRMQSAKFDFIPTFCFVYLNVNYSLSIYILESQNIYFDLPFFLKI